MTQDRTLSMNNKETDNSGFQHHHQEEFLKLSV